MEQWTWQKPVLQRLSKHYQTGKPLPEDLIDNMINSKNFCSALFNLRQLSFGIFDYKVHAEELTDSLLEVNSFPVIFTLSLLRLDLPKGRS